MTDDEIVLWLITKATMEDKPVMRLAADRLIQVSQALREHDDLVECNEQFSVDNQFLKKRVEETRKEWEGWQSAAFKLMGKVTALTAERDRLREALKPFAFFFDDDGEAKTMQQAWEIIYRDRVEDWVFYQEIVAARAALKGDSHE